MPEGTHENKYQVNVEEPPINKSIPRVLDSNNGGNYGWFPMVSNSS